MPAGFFKRKIDRLKAWWHAPTSAKDRVLGIAVGGMGGFWIGVLAFIAFGPSSISFTYLGLWVISSIALGIVAGAIFPKSVTIALFPLTFFGGGPST